ncbi:hypothetical protein J8273_1178 [Carpediemonas membranifera]|uniref:Uncharacterized protein n=1 Tax=Carpediemonas membranifera TaxID=201153 RepID=A0A8J6B2Y8_9EUKA|nr:hypothetical protein J8273_1160 [Carpediemonas membranifera]KAG9397263.1 hypothetical protein J8273_1178 [Carpediemonas membranifera]|eukprot:KAG9397245.1 hypothetical protein J8273_1160 [Carpediemonas membranifera]
MHGWGPYRPFGSVSRPHSSPRDAISPQISSSSHSTPATSLPRTSSGRILWSVDTKGTNGLLDLDDRVEQRLPASSFSTSSNASRSVTRSSPPREVAYSEPRPVLSPQQTPRILRQRTPSPQTRSAASQTAALDLSSTATQTSRAATDSAEVATLKEEDIAMAAREAALIRRARDLCA